MKEQQYVLEKTIWSDVDFEVMGWKDAHIHAIATIPESFELLLDIDYVVRWVDPTPPDDYFTFWVAPATLVFNNVHDVEVHLESQTGEFSICSINRSDEQATQNKKLTDWLWKIDTYEDSLSFRATGYQQYFRTQPILTQSQRLNFDLRNGISFKRDVEGK